MPTPQLQAVVVDSLELLAALMIALNFGARFFLVVTVLHVGISTCYLYDFRNYPGHGNAGCCRCLEEPRDHRRVVHDRKL
ncbi:hypothetical protein [Bradyrhizobium australiense]|uniref:hypothetical protein n=1 Tax=Bradyrhizobium australiense TaxID=2721161 RepID=UPI001F2202E4|nr:hypothetical protein [Bradyrhizobium australiense]